MKPTFEDVTEKFTGIVGLEHAELVQVWECSETLCHDRKYIACWRTSIGLRTGEAKFEDLIKRPPPKSPWDGFPLEHWWRESENAECHMRITERNIRHRSVKFGEYVKDIKFLWEYEHTADPINGKWEKGWGQS